MPINSYWVRELCLGTFYLFLNTYILLEKGSCRASLCGFGEIEDLPNGDFTCHCYPGYKGVSCDDLLSRFDNPCLQNPCWNSGVCASSGNTAVCLCSPLFQGSDCRSRIIPIMEVTKPPVQMTTPAITTMNQTTPDCNGLCLNGGSCQISGITFNCICKPDFTGLVCDTQIPLCERATNPCQNGGTCSNNTCQCTAGFAGELCQNTSKFT